MGERTHVPRYFDGDVSALSGFVVERVGPCVVYVPAGGPNVNGQLSFFAKADYFAADDATKPIADGVLPEAIVQPSVTDEVMQLRFDLPLQSWGELSSSHIRDRLGDDPTL